MCKVCPECKCEFFAERDHCSLKCNLLHSRIMKNECWEWHKNNDRNGYGRVQDRKTTKEAWKYYAVHRKSFEVFKGEIPKGLFVLHTCDNPKCYNPDHLWIGTQKDNMADCKVKGRHKNAILRGTQCHKAKLSEDDVREIRRMASKGMRECEIVEYFPVNDRSIGMIIRKETWKHVM